jgi:hypothetical protein
LRSGFAAAQRSGCALSAAARRRFRGLLPAWSICTTPAGRRPDMQIGEILGDEANDIVRPIIDAKVAVALKGAPWARAWTTGHLAAAVATLQEMTEGHPRLVVNEQILADRPELPVVAMMTDVNYGRGDHVLAVAIGSELCHSRTWQSPIIGCLYEWLVAVDDCGDGVAAELCETVLRGSTTTSLATYLVDDAYTGT